MTIWQPDTPLVAPTPIPNAATVWGPFPVGEWQSITVALQGPAAAATSLAVALSWDDVPGIVTRLWCGPNSGRLFAQIRNPGTQLRVTFTNPDAARYVAELVASNRPAASDGPRSPATQGQVIATGQTAALASLANVTQVLWGTGGSQLLDGYCGPALLYVRGASTTDPAVSAILRDTNGVLDATPHRQLAGAAASPGATTVAITIPPLPCELLLWNTTATAQAIAYSLVAA